MNKIVTTGFDYAPYSQRFVKASKARARKIRDHDRVAGNSIISMGGELKEQREAFGNLAQRVHTPKGVDTWAAWCQAELGFDKDNASRIIQMYEKLTTGAAPVVGLGHDIVKILSAKNTPQQLVDEVLKLAKEGKLPKKIKDAIKVVRAKKKKMVSSDPLPTPKEAKAQAKATGAVVLGSDDKFYTPLDEKDIEDYEQRRDRTYTVIDAIKAIVANTIPSGDWLDGAEKRWLDDLDLGDIEFAGAWLEQLRKDYKVYRKIIDNSEAENGNQESKAGSHPSP